MFIYPLIYVLPRFILEQSHKTHTQCPASFGFNSIWYMFYVCKRCNSMPNQSNMRIKFENKTKMKKNEWRDGLMDTTRRENNENGTKTMEKTHTLGFQLWILRKRMKSVDGFYFRYQRCCCLYDHRWTAGQRERNASISTENDLFMFFPTPIVLCFHGIPSTSHAYIMIYVQICGVHETCYRRRVACSAPHTTNSVREVRVYAGVGGAITSKWRWI